MPISAADLAECMRPGSLLADLPEDCLESLAPLGQVRAYDKGQTLFQKGDAGSFMAVILSGRLKVSGFSVSCTETVHNLLQRGDVVGEIAVIDGNERNADVVAIEKSELLVFPRGEVMRLLEDDAELALAFTRALCAKLRATSDALEAATLDIARRVAATLMRLAQQNAVEGKGGEMLYEIPIDQTTLAHYAGITRSNLNRVLKRFEGAGASVHEKGVLKILDLEWLEEFAASEE